MPNIGEYFKPGADITVTASAAVTGGQLVEFTGDRRVGPAAAGSLVVCGVARQDAAVEGKVAVASGGVYPLTATGAIAAGQRVMAAAGGTVAAVPAPAATPAAGDIANTRATVGYALEAIATGATGRIKLYV